METLVKPLLVELDQHLDRRLARTCLITLQAIIQFRDQARGLLLSAIAVTRP